MLIGDDVLKEAYPQLSISSRPHEMLSCCRDPTKAKELQEVLASASQQPPLPLDVSSDESVTKLAQLLQVAICSV